MTTEKTAAELEHEIESQRAYLALTLDKISARMTPGQVFDEAWEFARDSGGGEFVRNLGTSVRANPLPVALITAGIGWLMSGRSGSFPRISHGSSRPRDRIVRTERLDTTYDGYAGSERLEDEAWEEGPGFITRAARSVEETTSSARDRLGRAAEAASDAAQSAMDETRGSLESLRRSAGQGFRRFRESAGEQGRHVRARAETFADEQPVLLAVAGLALGALVGAMARSTATESRLMGEASDRLKRRAKDEAVSSVEQATEAAKRTYGAVREEAEREGLMGESARETVDELGRKVRKVAKKGKEQLEEELDAASGSTAGAT